MTITIVSFIVTMLVMTLSGLLSARHKQNTSEDYLIASQSVKPWLSALSAVATNNSGFMFIGMIGFTYRRGIESMWLAAGWVLGDLAVWLIAYQRIRRLTGETDASTTSELIGWKKDRIDRAAIIFSGLITLLFLGSYAAAQLKAGATALHAMLEWDMWIGVAIGTAIVIAYSFAGGIRADIWTDAAQSVAMFVSMLMIMVVGYWEIGGFQSLMNNLEQQDPSLVGIFPEELKFGIVAYLIGYACAGFGAMGQPHLVTRIMAVESPNVIRRTCFYYFLYYVPFFLLSIGVGLFSRALLPDLANRPSAQQMNEPTELALPLVSMDLLPQVFVGIALGGLFAATVSTADSQIIVCSGSITHDVTKRWKKSYLASKIGTAIVTTFAVLIALFAPEGVFGLVLIAWSAMGASLGPVLLLRVYDREYSSWTAVAMMTAAIAVVGLWHISPWNEDVLKIFPGMVAAAAVYGISLIIRWFSGSLGKSGSDPPSAEEHSAS